MTIDKKGLNDRKRGRDQPLPDIKIGDVGDLYQTRLYVTVKNPTGDASFEFEIKGKLKINLNGNEQEIAISAKLDKDGKFSGNIKELSLTIAKSKLDLQDVEFTDERFAAASATLTLPSFLASTAATINQVVIDENGLSFGDAAVKIPIEFTVGKEGDQPSPKNSIAVKGSLTLILAADRTYGFAVEGEVTIKLASQSAAAKGSFRMDSTGEMRGSIDSFELSIAGLTLAVKSATVEDGALKAQEATLSIPKEWGGLSASVYGVEISKEKFSISGGSFKLPEIKVGDMRLVAGRNAEGGKRGLDYRRWRHAETAEPGGGCGGLGVSVELATGSDK